VNQNSPPTLLTGKAAVLTGQIVLTLSGVGIDEKLHIVFNFLG